MGRVNGRRRGVIRPRDRGRLTYSVALPELTRYRLGGQDSADRSESGKERGMMRG